MASVAIDAQRSLSSSSMLFRRIFTSLARSDLKDLQLPFHSRQFSGHTVIPSLGVRFSDRNQFRLKLQRENYSMSDARRPPAVPIPSVATADKAELLRAIEAALGSSFSSKPLSRSPSPLVIVISGPSGVGKDAVIKKLREVREGLHFVVTATSRAKRPGEVDGKDYYFVTKEEFLWMVGRDELLEYALVYGDYKGIPKQQIREFMAKGYDIILRVDIQGAATLRSILGNSAVFIFLVAESELSLVKRLIDRKTETTETLLVRIATAREEVRHVKNFDYVVVNAEGELERAVKTVESIIDAEKARVRQRKAVI